MSQSHPVTLASINKSLVGVGLPSITKEQSLLIQGIAKKDKIIQAVNSLPESKRAKAFLEGLFISKGIITKGSSGSGNSTQHSGQQYTTPPREPQQWQQQIPQSKAPLRQRSYAKESAGMSAEQAAQYGNAEQPSSTPQNIDDRASVHVYGGRAALCFNADETKLKLPTIALDAALSISARKYDWQKKIRIQMTKQELPVVAAVMLGVIPSCEFKSHGIEKNKGFSLEKQAGGKVFVTVFAANEKVRAVPIESHDVFYVVSLLMRQIQKSCPWLDSASVLQLIRATQAK